MKQRGHVIEEGIGQEKRSLPPLFKWLLVVLIIGLAGCFSWLGSYRKSNTFDELVHVMGGITYWRFNDYRINPENGNLPQRVAASPLMLTNAYPPVDVHSEAWKQASDWELASAGWFSSKTAYLNILHQSRLGMLCLNMAGLLVVFLISRDIWGWAGGYLTLLLAAFSPNFLGHMPLATSDFAVSWMLLAAVYLLSSLFDKVCPAKIVLCGIAVGIALLAKHSALILGLVAMVLLTLVPFSRRYTEIKLGRRSRIIEGSRGALITAFGASILSAAICLVVVWMAYGFRYEMANPELPSIKTQALPDRTGIFIITKLFYAIKILPEAYLNGLQFIMENDVRTSFLNGSWSATGIPGYFLFCFLYKTPLPALLLHVFGSILFFRFYLRDWKSRSLQIHGLISLGIIYAMILFFSSLTIGYRHAFPVLLVSCVLAGIIPSNAGKLGPSQRALSFLVAMLLPFIAYGSRHVYISYINPIGGGPENGYKLLRDSSLDWGQDLPAAVEYIHKNRFQHPERPFYLAYFGSADPKVYGLTEFYYLPGRGSYAQTEFVPAIEPGTYVLSATSLFPGYEEWNPRQEADFQKKRKRAQILYKRLVKTNALDFENAREILSETEWNDLLTYEYVRFLRLCGVLSDMRPHKVLNGSILVFELTEIDFNSMGWKEVNHASN